MHSALNRKNTDRYRGDPPLKEKIIENSIRHQNIYSVFRTKTRFSSWEQAFIVGDIVNDRFL